MSRGCCTTWSLAHRDLRCRPSSLPVYPQHSPLLLLPLWPLLGSDTPPPSSAPRGHTAPNTDGQSGRSCWGLLLSVKCCRCFFFLLLCISVVTHSVGPASEVPVGYTGAHVALLASLRANPGVALLFVHHAALIAEAVHAPRPPPNSTVHRALGQTERRKTRMSINRWKKRHETERWNANRSHYLD